MMTGSSGHFFIGNVLTQPLNRGIVISAVWTGRQKCPPALFLLEKLKKKHRTFRYGVKYNSMNISLLCMGAKQGGEHA